jgi:hypothetical protein
MRWPSPAHAGGERPRCVIFLDFPDKNRYNTPLCGALSPREKVFYHGIKACIPGARKGSGYFARKIKKEVGHARICHGGRLGRLCRVRADV